MQGKLFVLDGCDGCGKTATLDILRDKLWEKYGDKVVVMHMPGATDLGLQIRQLVKSNQYHISPLTERLMFAVDSQQTMDEVVLPALAAGKIVLSDRWARFTDYAYGLARGLSMEEIEKVTHLITVPTVDCLFILNVPFETIIQRKKAILALASEQHDRFETLPGSTAQDIKINEEFLRKVHYFYSCPTNQSFTVADDIIDVTRKLRHINSDENEPSVVACKIFEDIVKIVGA